ncbi:MED7 protein-domain-containing protein [Flagelloscypha sp. PMI_526]|nr:MED7 protein-domain-containing protein [Flagelloscypha sp. PMI_526]
MEADDDGELRNPFPSPPSHYHKYTSNNLRLLALLKERRNKPKFSMANPDVPDWSLAQLEKPRIDWILEDEPPRFSVFGDTWFLDEKVMSLKEHGLQQFYPSDPTSDRRPALVSVLRSLLLTYNNLTASLLNPPPLEDDEHPPPQPDWVKSVEWLTLLGQNLMAAANELRPVQARGNLELMMKRQLEHRRNETAELHRRCDEWETKLDELRKRALDLPHLERLRSMNEDQTQASAPLNLEVSAKDVLAWAEEIG